MPAHPPARSHPTAESAPPAPRRDTVATRPGRAPAEADRQPELRVDAPGWWDRFWAEQPGHHDHR